MTTEELIQILNQTSSLLQENLNTFTPNTLNDLEKLINDLKFIHLGEENIITLLEKIIQFEKSLITTDLSNKLINVLNNLQNHHIILIMLAKLL